jgi:hypothetical protein
MDKTRATEATEVAVEFAFWHWSPVSLVSLFVRFSFGDGNDLLPTGYQMRRWHLKDWEYS